MLGPTFWKVISFWGVEVDMINTRTIYSTLRRSWGAGIYFIGTMGIQTKIAVRKPS